VKLTVYDLLGREVKKLLDEYRPAGAHNIGFNASRLATGIYLYKMETGGYSQFKKMQYVK
jgi:hypothetical protein